MSSHPFRPRRLAFDVNRFKPLNLDRVCRIAPAMLHISKVAVGCKSFDTLHRRQQKRLADGVVPIMTRFRPTRADELIGGSIYWIIRHRLAARQSILGFAEGRDRRTVIRLDPELIPVNALPKRAHQGWRYLDAADAPADFDGDDAGIAALPPGLLVKLSALALL